MIGATIAAATVGGMLIGQLSVGIPLGLRLNRRDRVTPATLPATPTFNLTELAEATNRVWTRRTPLAVLEIPTLHPWPDDEAAELIAAWQDERRR